VNADMRK